MRFNWIWPILAFLSSGWFFALFFALNPGFQQWMQEVPDGVVLNVIPPSIYIMFGFALNILGIVAGLFDVNESDGGGG